ncbi:MAG TPA: FtsX-like permease family protein [Gemmatimonadaceae bacterium]|jgi:putative ABC transport system permease protein
MKRGAANSPAPWMTVVGIAEDAKLKSIEDEPSVDYYTSMMQAPPVTLAMLLRTAQDAATLEPQIARVVHEVDRDQPVYHVQTMESVVSAAMGQRRFAMQLFAAFALLSLGLAAVGVYGLIAQSVTSRRREIGLRMAIGADPGVVLALIVREAITIGATGIGIGLMIALALSRVVASQLIGVSAHDPVVLLTVGAALLVVVAAASYFPGRQASRVDPTIALRSD